MINRTFGSIELENKKWKIIGAEPHVCIRLKNVFPKISKTDTQFSFSNTPENCHELLWFMDRYPLSISDNNLKKLKYGRKQFLKIIDDMQAVLLPGHEPKFIKLNEGEKARSYQLIAAELHSKQKRFLLGDDIGLGKTLCAILTFLNAGTLPAVVTCQTHLPVQWVSEINKYTNLTTHIIEKTNPYSLPKADVYIIKYSCLSGWVDIFQTGFFKSAVFDEIQKLRTGPGTNKYNGARVLSNNVYYSMGMSATPIYNYGNEIFNILNLINPGCLGEENDFLREWATWNGRHYKVNDPQALGAYLRENYLFLRRTREEVGRQLPPINTLVYTVAYDQEKVKISEQLAYELAITVTSASFVERGQAARELNALARHTTGASKAKEVAAFVKLLLENNEPVVLAGWHHDVYDIWMDELRDYKPVLYTGKETKTQKEAAKQAFISGQTDLFIISLRSGIGIDGLQHRCKNVVVGELDWSPKVHDQVIGRVDRDREDLTIQTNVYFLLSEYGSDPVIRDILALKTSQSHGIINPFDTDIAEQFSDDTHIKKLAESFISKRKLSINDDGHMEIEKNE